MFSKTAHYYDKIYGQKDYGAEVDRLCEIIRQESRAGNRTLLDVACGTGGHIAYLKAHYKVCGLDLDAGLLEIARQRHPEVAFYQGDMIDFDLAQRFDVLTCLFSAIGYVRTVDNLRQAMRAMARHLEPGGLLLVEPWFTPADWNPGKPHALLIDEPELKIARLSTSFGDGRLSWFDFHYLIATPEGTEHLVERHELGLFERSEMEAAMADAGLSAHYDQEGLTGRGLWIGAKPGSTGNREALSATKARMRARYRKLREAKTPEQVDKSSAALCRRLAEWDVLQAARRVMAYVAFRNELDLSPLFDLRPDIKWVVPRVVGQEMVLHPYDPERLVRHRFGMLEPAADLPTVSADTIDVVLVPGVAFDRQGGRMGFGGGFYDGFLPCTHALRVGITFDDCLLDEVPTDAHDQRMDWVVTPTRTLEISRTSD